MQHFWQEVLTFIVFAGCFLCLSCVRVRLIKVSAMRVPYHIVTCLLALLCCKRFHVVEHLFSDSVHESMNQGARCSSEPSDVHGERPVLAWSAAPFGMALWEKRKIMIDDGFLNNHPVQASSFLSMRRAQHVNGLIAMSVRREFVLMSVVFFQGRACKACALLVRVSGLQVDTR